MERRKIVLLAMGVVVAGICAAIPFRREHVETPPIVSQAVEAFVPAPVAAAVAEATAPPPAPPIATPEVESSNPTNEPPVSAAVSAAVPPPSSPAAPAATTPSPPSNETPIAAVSSPLVSTPTVSPSRPQSWRRHRIKDGDTLAKLAQEYLGDPARESEIFAINRDALPDPAILPIGVWLRIPAAE